MSEITLKGKTVIVTGAANGLGRAYALDIARSGGALVVNDIDEAALDALAVEARALGAPVRTHGLSIAAPGAAQGLIDIAVREFGSLDGLVNNAGLRPEGAAWAEDPQAVRAAVEVNLLGSILCGIAALRVMREQRSGSVINVSSRAQSGVPESATYSATKGALASLTYSWAIDVLPHGVRVNAIAPQASGTGTRRQSTTRLGEPTPEEMAPLVRYLLSDRSHRITGQVIRVGRPGAGATRLALMTHPQTPRSYAREHGWSAEALADLFESTLAAELVPFGAVPIDPSYPGSGGGLLADDSPWL